MKELLHPAILVAGTILLAILFSSAVHVRTTSVLEREWCSERKLSNMSMYEARKCNKYDKNN